MHIYTLMMHTYSLCLVYLLVIASYRDNNHAIKRGIDTLHKYVSYVAINIKEEVTMKTFRVTAEFFFDGDLISLNDLLESIGADDYTIKLIWNHRHPVPIDGYIVDENTGEILIEKEDEEFDIPF